MLGWLLARRKKEPAPDLALISLAASAIREYAAKHAALFERAERLREKADRLEKAGIPSESAANRAKMARLLDSGEIERHKAELERIRRLLDQSRPLAH